MLCFWYNVQPVHCCQGMGVELQPRLRFLVWGWCCQGEINDDKACTLKFLRVQIVRLLLTFMVHRLDYSNWTTRLITYDELSALLQPSLVNLKLHRSVQRSINCVICCSSCFSSRQLSLSPSIEHPASSDRSSHRCNKTRWDTNRTQQFL